MKRKFFNVVIGGALWCAVTLVPWDPNRGIGMIEKLFLLGPLVVVPLGLQLVGVDCRWLLLMAAIGAALSFLAPTGIIAGLLVTPWLLVCIWIAVNALLQFRVHGVLSTQRLGEICRLVAKIGLVVGGLGLLQSRWGMEPMGFREPLVLLVAVHFHFAAFVAPLMAAEVVERMRAESQRMKWILALCAVGGSPLLAGGYVLHLRGLRLTGAMLLVGALVMMAAWMLRNLRVIEPFPARLLLGVSAMSAFAAMIYAGVYALADFLGAVWIAIPQMARTHGILQAVGFSVCGLLGWILSQNKNELKLQSLTRRWH
jgi:YndJ-like protein